MVEFLILRGVVEFWVEASGHQLRLSEPIAADVQIDLSLTRVVCGSRDV